MNSPTATVWTPTEDKTFENALLHYPDGTPNRWHMIALALPGKSPEDVYVRYHKLVYDIYAIETGAVDIPYYDDDDDEGESSGWNTFGTKRGREERKRGIPWSEDEHRRFLEGLEKFGKGDWRMISRMAVLTRTPTQVASHAQKYFLRKQKNASSSGDNKRKSIHDLTN